MGRLQRTFILFLLCIPLAISNRSADQTVHGLGARVEGYASPGIPSAMDWHNVEPNDPQLNCAVYRDDIFRLTAIEPTASVNMGSPVRANGTAGSICRNLMAEAIRTITDLYRDGILVRPEELACTAPDALALSDLPDCFAYRIRAMYERCCELAERDSLPAEADRTIRQIRYDLTVIQRMALAIRLADGERADIATQQPVNMPATQEDRAVQPNRFIPVYIPISLELRRMYDEERHDSGC
jgi:hypothetical protein